MSCGRDTRDFVAFRVDWAPAADDHCAVPPGNGLPRHLDEWVRASLITEGQADAIRAFEDRRAPRASVTLITEALGYLGAALAAAAAAVLVGRSWNDASPGLRILLPGVASLVMVAAGWSLRRTEDAAIARLASVLWLLAAGLSGWFGGQLASDGFDASDQGVVLGIGIGVTVTAVPLYLVRRRTLQQLAVITGLMILAAGTFWGSGMSVGLAYLVIGLAWTALGWMGRAEPRRVSLTLGPLAGLTGAFVASGDRTSLGVWLGIAVSVGLVAASVSLRHTPMLGLGVAGLFAFSVWAIGFYFGETIGTPLVLLVAGVILLAVAFVAARLRGLTSERSSRPRCRGFDRRSSCRTPSLQPGMPSNLAFRFLSDFMASPRIAG
ncbi:MAG TPA: DUF2157 domain-containing protein [Actinomycetota bacterium]